MDYKVEGAEKASSVTAALVTGLPAKSGSFLGAEAKFATGAGAGAVANLASFSKETVDMAPSSSDEKELSLFATMTVT